MRQLNIGVIGCGLISQIMHLPNLRDLPELFKICAICDLSQELLEKVGDDYGIGRRYTNFYELIKDPIVDIVMVLSSGDHAPIVLAALNAGKHVFVEKPLCFSLKDADEIIDSSLRQNLCLMVGYMKWFDPAYLEAKNLFGIKGSPQFVQMTTINTPEQYYYRHHRLHLPSVTQDPPRKIDSRRMGRLLDELTGVPPALLNAYIDILLDSAIHDLYVLRGLIGDPREVVSAHFWAENKAVNVCWRYSWDSEARYDFLLLSQPGGRYVETVACYNPEQRLFLDFPSPYLKNFPTSLRIEEVVEGDIVQTRREGTFEEAFKQELVHFHECICNGSIPISSGAEGRKDIALMQEVLRKCYQ